LNSRSTTADSGRRRASQPITDSAATYLEPTLKAWNIPYHLVETDDDLENMSKAFKDAQEQGRTVAVLIGREYE